MKLSIFDVYVPMEDQEQCLRMKQLCVDYGLPIWESRIAFHFDVLRLNYFEYDDEVGFGIYCGINNLRSNDFTQVTEAEFINLLKEYKNGN